MCDAKVFEVIPVKKEVKAVVSGIYITSLKSVRGRFHRGSAEKEKRASCKIQKKD